MMMATTMTNPAAVMVTADLRKTMSGVRRTVRDQAEAEPVMETTEPGKIKEMMMTSAAAPCAATAPVTPTKILRHAPQTAENSIRATFLILKEHDRHPLSAATP